MFPYYLVMGMSPQDYWSGSPEMAEAYREAYKIYKEERNWEMWLQGLYFNHALNVALSNTFGKNSTAKYMDKPIDIFPPDEEEIKRKQIAEAKELERRLNAFAERFNARK